MTSISANYGNYQANQYNRKDALKEAALVLENTGDLKNIDADTFNRLKDIVNNVEVDPESKVQGPLKTVMTAVLLAGASALTAKVAAGRIMTFLGKNTTILEKASKGIMNLINKGKKYLKGNPNIKEKTLKGAILRAFQSAIKWVDKYSTKGIGDSLKAIKGKGSQAQKAMLRGENLIKNATGMVAAAGATSKTLYETTKDEDKNGVADIAEGKKTPSKELTSALLDCALDAA